MFYTFYSFKGGVGRSMSLANVGELLYRRGLKVLMVDFDLEAPGLERFFEGAENIQDSEVERFFKVGKNIPECRGVIDMVLSYKALRALPTTGVEPANNLTKTKFPFPVEPLSNFITPIKEHSNGGALYLISAGQRSKGDYSQFAERVQKLDWDDFYLNWNGEQFFDWFRDMASTYADVVLVDSRTGITEMSGICTYHLADVVVMFVAPNQQNLDGTLLIANSLHKRKTEQEQNNGRQLEILIIPSRVDISESPSLAGFKAQFLRELTRPPFATAKLKFENDQFDDLKIPYIPRYGYFEKVAVREPDQPVAAELVAAYNRLVTAMVELAPKSSRFYRRYFSQTRLASVLAEGAWVPKPLTDFTGYVWVFAALDRWLAAESPSIFLLTGEPGCGKTTLAFRLVQISQGEVEIEDVEHIVPGTLAFAHFCTPVDVRSLEPLRFVTSLSLALANRYPGFATALAELNESQIQIDVRQNISATASGGQVVGIQIDSIHLAEQDVRRVYAQLVREPLQKLYAQGFSETIVILIDGLDAALVYDSQDNLVSLGALAVRQLPPQVRFILTSRRDPRVLTAFNEASMLDLVNDLPFIEGDIQTYALTRLRMYAEVERQQLADQIASVSQGNFLYAKLLLDELTVNVATTGKLDMAALPRGIEGVYYEFMHREIGPDMKRWAERDALLLGVLSVSQEHGLTTGQLAGILQRSQTEIIDLLRPWIKYLHGALPDGPFKPFHASFRTFLLTNQEYQIHQLEAHQAIADFFMTEYGGEWEICQDEYALRYTPKHLLAALNAASGRKARLAMEDKLTTLLTDASFLEAKTRQVSLEAVLEDLQAAPANDAILESLGLTYYEQGEYEKAIETYKQAIKIARKRHDQKAESTLLGNLGLTYYDLGQIERAIEYFEQALAIAREIGDRQNEGTWLGNLGISFSALGQSKQAVEFYTQALAIAQKTEDLQGKGVWLANLGLVYEDQGEWEQAAEFYEKSLATMDQLGDISKTAIILSNLGNVQANRGDLDLARTLYQRSLAAMERIGDTYNMPQILNNLGIIYQQKGELQQAITAYERSLEIAQNIGNRSYEGNILSNLGNVFLDLGESSNAIRYYEQALKIFREVDDHDGEVMVLDSLAGARQESQQGDTVSDDRSAKLTIGNITGTGVAIGQGARATVERNVGKSELDQLLSPIMKIIHKVSSDKKEEAMKKAEVLKSELAKGSRADDTALAKSVDSLAALVPKTTNVLVQLLNSPNVAGNLGPVTRFVVERISSE
jgi:tetratricopeptide (TPR) repeat protein/MinD-like ATPase involved in chromosome partitioning or flagellar assembly